MIKINTTKREDNGREKNKLIVNEKLLEIYDKNEYIEQNSKSEEYDHVTDSSFCENYSLINFSNKIRGNGEREGDSSQHMRGENISGSVQIFIKDKIKTETDIKCEEEMIDSFSELPRNDRHPSISKQLSVITLRKDNTQEPCGRMDSMQPSTDEENIYRCSLCSFTTVYKHSLKKHIFIHTGERPYTCRLCPYQSTTKSNLNLHILRIHKGEKPFSCNLCNHKTSGCSSMQRHMLTHSGEKPFSCHLCDYKTTVKANLNYHLLIHTGEKPFICYSCPYRARRLSRLKAHILTHKEKIKNEAKFINKKKAATICNDQPISTSVLNIMSKYRKLAPKEK